MAGLHLGDTVHHVDRRIACAGCGSRVFTFATARDDKGVPVADYCPHCAHRLRGVTLCAACQRPVVETPGGWQHTDGNKRRHPVAPEKPWTYGGPVPLEPQQPFVRRNP